MKKNQQVTLSLITALSIFIYSCGPNDDKGGMDSENSNKEGAVDSTRIPGFDSTPATDSPHASLSGRDVLIHTVQSNDAKIKLGFFRKEKNDFS